MTSGDNLAEQLNSAFHKSFGSPDYDGILPVKHRRKVDSLFDLVAALKVLESEIKIINDSRMRQFGGKLSITGAILWPCEVFEKIANNTKKYLIDEGSAAGNNLATPQ